MTAPGYRQPTSSARFPKGLTLVQFIQTVLAGVSNLPGTLVREKWQEEVPKDPNIDVNWLSFGIEVANPDANAFVGVNPDGSTSYQRHEELEVRCEFYGPQSLETAGLVRDGFQIDQNRYALFQNKMAFINVSGITRMPDLVNGRFRSRQMMSVNLRREIQRTYTIPTIVSISGFIHEDTGGGELTIPFAVDTPPIDTESGLELQTESGETLIAERQAIPSGTPIATEDGSELETEDDEILDT